MSTEIITPVDPDVKRLIDLLAKKEIAIEQREELGKGKLNRVLSIRGQLMVKPDGQELYEDLPGEVKELIRDANRKIRPMCYEIRVA